MPKGVGTIIIKHANPSGISIDKKQLSSFNQAFNCDPVSAFGGIIICNYKVKYETAKEINKKFFEVVVAKDFDGKALSILKKKIWELLNVIKSMFPVKWLLIPSQKTSYFKMPIMINF